MAEPEILVNGVHLSEGQAMTVRVAINNLLLDVVNNGLGEDETGKAIAAAYRERANEVLKLMSEPRRGAGKRG